MCGNVDSTSIVACASDTPSYARLRLSKANNNFG